MSLALPWSLQPNFGHPVLGITHEEQPQTGFQSDSQKETLQEIVEGPVGILLYCRIPLELNEVKPTETGTTCCHRGQS